MASGKKAGPSGIVPEMLKPVGEAGAVKVHGFIEVTQRVVSKLM